MRGDGRGARELEISSSQRYGQRVPHSAAQVLAECHAAGRSGIFILGDHALDRANERNLGREDIRNALSNVNGAALQENGRWRVTGGTDLDGDAVTLVVTLYRGLVVITLF